MKDPLPADIFASGQVLNNTYEIEGVLGRGGTGEVYRARNQITGRVVAIKALNAQFSGNEDYIELMKREEEMRNILHDAVVRYTDCSRTDAGHTYLVMDYIDGPSLADAMATRRVDDRELLIIAHRVAEGLVATHNAGIVHRDLSPDNIILRGGKAEASTIIDFGIAKDTAAGARTIVGNDFAGKYEYAAPEQLEGHADARTDLYSLGATLLAAFRGETPFLGTTPGEIVRRKQTPLDTQSVPEPLGRGLIERLTQPDPAARPANAAEVVSELDTLFAQPQDSRDARKGKKAGAKDKSSGGEKKKRGGLAWLFLPTGLAGAALVAWATGLLDPLFVEPLPEATPYRLTATVNDLEQVAFANAPDRETGERLRAGLAAATGQAPESVQIELATGMPDEGWPERVRELIGLAAGLEIWRLDVEDNRASVSGLAVSSAARDLIEAELSGWSDIAGVDVTVDLLAGPVRLESALVKSAIDSLANCGPLSLDRDGPYGLNESIRITGDLGSAVDRDRLSAALEPLVGDRNIELNTRVLNEELCAIRAVLPPVPPNAISIWLGDGDTGDTNLSGVFTTGQNPVVEIHTPSTQTTGSLWVMVVDTSGKVFHVLPHLNRTEHELAELGQVEGGLRQVRVLHSVEEFVADPSLLAMRVTEEDYGKSEVIAILTATPLFDIRRPRDESVISVAAALKEALQGREDEVLGVAARIIDARR